MIRSNNKIQFTALAYSVIIVTTSGYVKGIYCTCMHVHVNLIHWPLNHTDVGERRQLRQCLCQIANHLAVRMGWSLSKATVSLYSRLSLVLIRANARAMLSRTVNMSSWITCIFMYGMHVHVLYM